MNTLYPAIAEFLSRNQDQILADLMTLVRYPSISRNGQDGFPFGKDVDDVLCATAALFRQNGIPMTVHHESGYALAILEGQGDGIGVFGHADVVPVNDDWVKTQPFVPIEENGFLYGRGISDNKAGVIASLYAVLALRAIGREPKSRIVLYTGGSEETGMQDLDAFVRQERMPQVSLVPDSGFPLSIGEKGILRLDCRSIHPLQDIKRFDGGKAYNVILDQVDVELGSGARFQVKGLTAHASAPEGSINAALKAAEQLVEQPICAGDKIILQGLQHILSDCYGGTLGIASNGAFGKLTCANGITRVEPDGHLFFTLDIRYGSETNLHTMLPALTASLDRLGFRLTIQEDDPGFLLDENSRELDTILNTCRACGHRPDAQPFKMGGGTYARKLKNAFALSHCLPLVEDQPELPASHGGAHQSDEFLNVQNWLGGIATLACILSNLDTLLTQENTPASPPLLNLIPKFRL